MNLINNLRKILILTLLLWGQARAQGRLDKAITIKIHRQPLAQALTEIGRKGGFYFSYNTNIIKGDSLVTLEAEARPVRQILDKLLGDRYEYEETGQYVILLLKTAEPPVRIYSISGYVRDENTKEKLTDASVYESHQLASTLTDSNGFFRLRLKDKYAHAVIIISKQLYRDTLLLIRPGYDQEFAFSLEPAAVAELAPLVVTNHVERTWLGKWLLSPKQVLQSMNLAGFFADKPVQFSLLPGLGSHGRMGAQVINKFSLNLLGGYTAGVNGLELAGVFNIDQRSVRWLQAAGVANINGGAVSGVQLAGVHNQDLDSVKGVQAAGVGNVVMGGFGGVQLAGLFNKVKGRTSGLQAAGLANSSGEVDGVQVSGFLNSTRRLKGVQIGLINIADTSTGYMIGLVNIVKNGYHELSLSADETLPINLSYKTGTRKIYSILRVGYSPGRSEDAYATGIGIGNEHVLSRCMSLASEFYLLHFYRRNGEDAPLIYRIQPSLKIRLAKKLSLSAGPAFSFYTGEKNTHSFSWSGNSSSWWGWTTAINFF
ncbi:MAG TPA: hypothetical protein VGM30_13175 [Puia sp.]|jgi:hypothetical protein